MNSKFVTLLVIALLFLCGWGLFSLFSFNTTVVLDEVLAGRPIGVLVMIPPEQMPEEAEQGTIWAKYTSLLPAGGTIPADGRYTILRPANDDRAKQCGDSVVSAGVWFHGFMPTRVSQEAGEKVYVLTMGLYGIGPCGWINTEMVPDPNYNPNFKPNASAESIWNIPGCILRVRLVTGGDIQSNCLDAGFMPTDNVGGMGPAPSGVNASNGVFVYYAYANGVWAQAVTPQVLNDVLQTGKADPSLIGLIQNFINTGTVQP